MNNLSIAQIMKFVMRMCTKRRKAHAQNIKIQFLNTHFIFHFYFS